MKKIKNLIKKSPLIFFLIKFIYRKIKLPLGRWFYILQHSTKPISENYGFDRGTPIDRYYIENFLKEHSGSIKDYCLEIKNNEYTVKFGGNAVKRSDILDIDKTNKNATIIGDLRNLISVADETYDCIILTQVLQFIDDSNKAISECWRILKPNGVLLATMPSISRIDCRSGIDEDYWRFTQASARFLFEKFFPKNNLLITPYGNTLSGYGFWIGLAKEELSQNKIDKYLPDFPVVITVYAKKYDGKI